MRTWEENQTKTAMSGLCRKTQVTEEEAQVVMGGWLEGTQVLATRAAGKKMAGA